MHIVCCDELLGLLLIGIYRPLFYTLPKTKNNGENDCAECNFRAVLAFTSM